MNIKKILLIIGLLFIVTGCTKLEDMSYDDIINKVIVFNNRSNTFRTGFKYYIPKGLQLDKAGANYAIIKGDKIDYYLFVDLISYNSSKEITHSTNSNYEYSKLINYDNKKGYVDIKKYENNQYLIEIMYNYAKIEVMVDDSEVKVALANSMNILKSIVYDKNIIEALLKEDNLTYTEEYYDMFSKSKKKSSILDYTEGTYEEENDNPINDADIIN